MFVLNFHKKMFDKMVTNIAEAVGINAISHSMSIMNFEDEIYKT